VPAEVGTDLPLAALMDDLGKVVHEAVEMHR
jgi:hypothetical protein